jgi:flagellar hook assembly protein FlgD
LSATNVTLKIYDILGREVATLVNKNQKAGNYEVKFNASTSSSTANELTSGIYFYRIVAGKFVDTKKLILLK